MSCYTQRVYIYMNLRLELFRAFRTSEAWTEIASSEEEWHLLVEDDIKFTHKAAECWNGLVTPLGNKTRAPQSSGGTS